MKRSEKKRVRIEQQGGRRGGCRGHLVSDAVCGILRTLSQHSVTPSVRSIAVDRDSAQNPRDFQGLRWLRRCRSALRAAIAQCTSCRVLGRNIRLRFRRASTGRLFFQKGCYAALRG
jgi:hypothetical protein